MREDNGNVKFVLALPPRITIKTMIITLVSRHDHLWNIYSYLLIHQSMLKKADAYVFLPNSLRSTYDAIFDLLRSHSLLRFRLYIS